MDTKTFSCSVFLLPDTVSVVPRSCPCSWKDLRIFSFSFFSIDAFVARINESKSSNVSSCCYLLSFIVFLGVYFLSGTFSFV